MDSLAPLITQLKRHEGFRSKIYVDTTGHRTIGYGTNLEVGITKEQAEGLLFGELKNLAEELTSINPWVDDLLPARYAVLLNMAYNLGIKGLLRFRKMWAALEKRNFAEAADEMMDSLWAKQVKNRAAELSRQMRTGTWDFEY